MALRFAHSALSVVAGALASVFAPPSEVTPSAWAAENLIVVDGPHANDKWSVDVTPYVVEPLDKFGPHDPTNRVAIRKSAQTGFTTLAIAAVGHAIDCDPCRMMLVQPTSDALGDFNREKLGPAIEQSAALRKRVAPQTSRSGEGSTSSSKKYPGGSLTLAIASSTADLRSKTIKKAYPRRGVRISGRSRRAGLAARDGGGSVRVVPRVGRLERLGDIDADGPRRVSDYGRVRGGRSTLLARRLLPAAAADRRVSGFKFFGGSFKFETIPVSRALRRAVLRERDRGARKIRARAQRGARRRRMDRRGAGAG
jgi:hypothetical protein